MRDIIISRERNEDGDIVRDRTGLHQILQVRQTGRNWKGGRRGEWTSALKFHRGGVIRPCLFISFVARPCDAVAGRLEEEGVCAILKLVLQYLASVSFTEVGTATTVVVFASSDVHMID